MDTKVIVGLGNLHIDEYMGLPTANPVVVEELRALQAQGLYIDPDTYRHNAGFRTLEQTPRKKAFKYSPALDAQIALAVAGNSKVVLVRPTTTMNRSGLAVKAVLSSCNVSPANMLLVYDDKDLPLGKLRFQPGDKTPGSGGGHNGVKSVMTELGSNEFARLKIGVGPLPAGARIIKFVLSPFPAECTDHYARVIAAAAEASLLWAADGFANAKVTNTII